jgi:hypothetical protein
MKLTAVFITFATVWALLPTAANAGSIDLTALPSQTFSWSGTPPMAAQTVKRHYVQGGVFIPEPPALMLLGVGLLGLAFLTKKKFAFNS